MAFYNHMSGISSELLDEMSRSGTSQEFLSRHMAFACALLGTSHGMVVSEQTDFIHGDWLPLTFQRLRQKLQDFLYSVFGSHAVSFQSLLSMKMNHRASQDSRTEDNT